MRRNVGRKPQTSANLAAFLHIIDTSRLLAVLREDNRAIFRAASAASKAADWLLARHAAAQAEAVQAEATQGDTSRDETGERQAPQDERISA
jgi:antirestriction protein ArdC